MTIETAKEAQRLLRVVTKLKKDATHRVRVRDINTLSALGFIIHSEQVHPEPRVYWLETKHQSDQALALWQAEEASNQRALAMLQEMAAAVETKAKRPMKNTQAPTVTQDATDFHGATLQVRNSIGDTVFKMTLGQRVFFTGADGSVIRVGIDQDGNLRLWVDEQLVILPVSTNTVKVIEQKVCVI